MKNYGKLSAFDECYQIINSDLNGVSLDTAIDEIVDKSFNYMKLTSYKVMMPAKYQFYGEFRCTATQNLWGQTCSAGQPTGSCFYDQVTNSDVKTTHVAGANAGNGYYRGYLGGNTDDAHDVLTSSQSSTFNTLLSTLQAATGTTNDISLLGIVNSLLPQVWVLNDGQGTVTMFDITFTFNIHELPYCHNQCSGPQCQRICLGIQYWGCGGYYTCSFGACFIVDWASGSNSRVEFGKQVLENEDNLVSDRSLHLGGIPHGGASLTGDTSVLTRIGGNGMLEWKYISNITQNDYVLNPLTGKSVQVLSVSQSARSLRNLYQINNNEFGFSSMHPFVKYLSDDNISVAVMDSETLTDHYGMFESDYLYQNIKNIIEYSLDNSSMYKIEYNDGIILSSYMSDTFVNIEDVSIEINSARDVTFEDTDEILYDLLLNASYPSAYIINDYMIVSNKWYDFIHYSLTNQIYLSLMNKLLYDDSSSINNWASISQDFELPNSNISNSISNTIIGNKSDFYDIINDHIENNFYISNMEEDCYNNGDYNIENYTYTPVLNNDIETLAVLLHQDWATKLAFEQFISIIGNKIEYVFSKFFVNASNLCMNDDLVENLVSDLAYEMKIISNQTVWDFDTSVDSDDSLKYTTTQICVNCIIIVLFLYYV